MKINLFQILMICVLCWFALVMAGCNFNKKHAHFTKQDGTLVVCESATTESCGERLWRCDDGHNYSCVQNVEYY